MGGRLWSQGLRTSCSVAVPVPGWGCRSARAPLTASPRCSPNPVSLSESQSIRILGVSKAGSPEVEEGAHVGSRPCPATRRALLWCPNGRLRVCPACVPWTPEAGSLRPVHLAPRVAVDLGPVIAAVLGARGTPREAPPRASLTLQRPLEPFWGDNGPSEAFVAGPPVKKHCSVQKEG